MRIFYDDTYIDVICDNDSERVNVVNNVESVTLNYSLPSHVKLPTGAYIEFQGKRYTLFKPRNFKKHNSRNFEYTVIFEDYGAMAKSWTFKFPETGELKFELIYTPRMFLDLFVENMNLRDSGWSVGSCIEATEKPIAFNQVKCFDALGLFTNAFETEFELNGKTVSLGKVEYNKANPLEISYKAGFKAGVECNVDDESSDIEILNVQGGDRNINYSEYGSKNLLLPKNQSLKYDGTYFDGETGFVESKSYEYIVSSDGLSIQREDREIVSYSDDNLDCAHIYPNWEHVVTKVEKTDGNVDEESGVDNGHWNIYAENTTDYPTNSHATIDYEDCRIPTEKATVIFQSGMLSSKEFVIVQSETSLTGYDYETKKFELVSIVADSQVLPNDIHKPKIGDKFRVFNISLPDTYVCDNDTKTGASWDMFREAVKYLYEREQMQISIDGTLDGVWTKKYWSNVGGKLVLGGYTKVSDVDFAPDGVLIRITEIRQSINNPHSPEIKLSNKIVSKVVSSTIKKVASNEVKVDSAQKSLKEFLSKRHDDVCRGVISFLSHIKVNSQFVTSTKIALWDKVSALFDTDANGDVYVKDNKGFYSNSFISALGVNSDSGSGSGSIGMDAVWTALLADTTEQINSSHLTSALSSYTTTNSLNILLDQKLNASSYTASDILTKIKTVDGADSGLDADTLDGVHNGELTAIKFKRLDTGNGYIGEGSNSDANMLIRGGMTWNYYGDNYWQNTPSGMKYGSIINLTCGASLNGHYECLSAQFAWDVNHNTTSPTRKLWFRTANNLGFGNDWKQIATINDAAAFDTLTIKSTDVAAHLQFSRSTYNYIRSAGSLSFITSNKSLTTATMSLHITDTGVGVKKANPTCALDVAGDVAATGGIYCLGVNNSSDMRLKTNIESITSARDFIDKINVFSHTWKNGDGKTIGISAQWLQNTDYSYLVHDLNDRLSVDYKGLQMLSFVAIKETNKELDDLKNEVAKLKNKVKLLNRELWR